MAHEDSDTVEFETKSIFVNSLFATDHPRLSVSVVAATHPGKVRPRNEDHHAVIRRVRSTEMLYTNLPQNSWSFTPDENYILMVADGVGGAAFGDIASRVALETVLELSGRATSWLMKVTDLDADDVRHRVDAYIDHIQATLHKYAESNSNLRGMGTTLTAASLIPPYVVFVNIGDSRGYLYRSGQLNQITHDQTLAQDMIDAGADPESVRKFGNRLTNSLHGDGTPVKADMFHAELQVGDRLLLCSDGLSDMVDRVDIAATLSTASLESTCDQLVKLALDGGGRDNITIVLSELVSCADIDI